MQCVINGRPLKYNVHLLLIRYKEHMSYFMNRQSKNYVNLELSRPNIKYIYLQSNNKVRFKKAKERKYVLYLRKPRVRGVTVWNMLGPAYQCQVATTKVKFKKYTRAICRAYFFYLLSILYIPGNRKQI